MLLGLRWYLGRMYAVYVLFLSLCVYVYMGAHVCMLCSIFTESALPQFDKSTHTHTHTHPCTCMHTQTHIPLKNKTHPSQIGKTAAHSISDMQLSPENQEPRRITLNCKYEGNNYVHITNKLSNIASWLARPLTLEGLISMWFTNPIKSLYKTHLFFNVLMQALTVSEHCK